MSDWAVVTINRVGRGSQDEEGPQEQQILFEGPTINGDIVIKLGDRSITVSREDLQTTVGRLTP